MFQVPSYKFQVMRIMDGLLRCAYYAFGPNRLHYCGPDKNREILAYMRNKTSNPGLESLLKSFQTMYPYLRHIAWSNNIKDPFNEKVIEAYWIGNDLLDAINKKRFYCYLLEDLEIKKKIGIKPFDAIIKKLRQGAVPHHSFHVINIWLQRSSKSHEEILQNIELCRISWGKVLDIDGPNIAIETEPLLIENKTLVFGKPIVKKITRGLDANYEIEQLKIDDIITTHWGVPCEVISNEQVKMLRKYTERHIKLVSLNL